MCDLKLCEHSAVFYIFTMSGLKSCEYGEQRNLMGLGDLCIDQLRAPSRLLVNALAIASDVAVGFQQTQR